MKEVAFLCALLALTNAANEEPHPKTQPYAMVILKDLRTYPDALGGHSLDLETENGIVIKTFGALGIHGGSIIKGSYNLPLDDGTYVPVRYVGDERGYRVESSLLPVPPPFPHAIPQHSIDQIMFGEEQKRLRAEAEAAAGQAGGGGVSTADAAQAKTA